MKKYYLHNGTESSGPFEIEELKAKKITKASPVWFEGMQHWKTAGEIPELNQLFVINPPTFPPFLTQKPETKRKATKILGLSKSTFGITCAAIILLVGISVLKIIEDHRSQELKIKNHKTEIENYQLEQKQKELEEDKIQAVIQEKIDSERKANEMKQSSQKRLMEIEKLLVNSQTNLDATENKLTNAADFKLLRTAAEKKEQMNLLQNNIDSIKNSIERLKKESNQLKLELEKIH